VIYSSAHGDVTFTVPLFIHDKREHALKRNCYSDRGTIHLALDCPLVNAFGVERWTLGVGRWALGVGR